jgi:hypothetical protein
MTVAAPAPAAEWNTDPEAYDRRPIGIGIGWVAIAISTAIAVTIAIGRIVGPPVIPAIVAAMIIRPAVISVRPVVPAIIAAVPHFLDRLGNTLIMIEQGGLSRCGQCMRRRGENTANGHRRKQVTLWTTSPELPG